ncbi:CSLREA domain-containing protein [Herpetosiphon geysericola]|uniref:CSLREA domain-containing protein n=1 Tax=Herpetosiphon geysericola TaxID=70996 RepID=A0A0P6Z3E5_9CHLR|nr:CSLREA domain-containing protein [Herpetosiphon geysericola]KPL91942.1 hypothetical protein SE18_00920 [Herpetosiphon geysericola]
MRFLHWIGLGSLGLALSWQAAAANSNQPQVLHTTITVNTVVDDFTPNNGTCSLREAIQAANTDLAVDACPAGSASDTIQLAAGSYQLSLIGSDGPQTGDLDLNGSIQITGVTSATSIIDANRIDRAMEITGGNVRLSNLQVREGFLDGIPEQSTVYGHGILHHAGSLTIDSSLITTNGIITSPATFGYNNYGGGIASLSGYLTITNSLIERNRVRHVYMGGIGSGGGLYIDATSVNMSNSTLRESQGAAGSAIYNSRGRLNISNSTIAGHVGTFDGSAAIANVRGELTLSDTNLNNNTPKALVLGGGSATIRNSSFIGNGGGGSFYCSYGGAIASYGQLAISNSRFVGNWANEAGAIGVVTGTTTIDHSEFSANYAQITSTGRDECRGNGGVIQTGNNGKVSIDSSTLAYNRADGYAAAIYHSYNPNPLIIHNSTIVSNTNSLLHPYTQEIVEDDGPGIAALNSSSVQLSNTILAGNRNEASNVARDCSGLFLSHGYVLIEHADAVCDLTQATGDLLGVQPKLESFAFHGGATRSFSLSAASPAIDAGSSDCGPTDQRYVPRPVDGDNDDQALCDIGSFEFAAAAMQDSVYLPMTMK